MLQSVASVRGPPDVPIQGAVFSPPYSVPVQSGVSCLLSPFAPILGPVSLWPPSCHLALPRIFQSSASVCCPLDVPVRGGAFLLPYSAPDAPVWGLSPSFLVCPTPVASGRLALPRMFQSIASVRGPLDVPNLGAAFLPPYSAPVAPVWRFLPYVFTLSTLEAARVPSLLAILLCPGCSSPGRLATVFSRMTQSGEGAVLLSCSSLRCRPLVSRI